MNPYSSLPRARILGVSIDNLSLDQVLDSIQTMIEERQKCVVAYVNIQALNLAHQIPEFRAFINCAGLVFCDGFGVLLAAKLLGQRLEYRFTPPDWFPRLMQICAARGFSVFFLGAAPGVVERLAERYLAEYPGLRVAGTHNGYFDKTPGSTENTALLEQINLSSADILVIGFGMPLQERWLQDNWEQLNIHVALPTGAMFDYLGGVTRRAPRWMTDHGFEWLGRLIIEPRRLWKRYLIGIPLFFARVLRQKFARSQG